MLHGRDVEAECSPAFDWPVYPRRAEHNTIAEGGNRGWAEIARQNAVPIALAEADEPRPGPLRGVAGTCRKNAPRPCPRDTHGLGRDATQRPQSQSGASFPGDARRARPLRRTMQGSCSTDDPKDVAAATGGR